MAAGTERRAWALLAGTALLLVLLAAQIVLANRDRLAEHPGWRPLLSRMCVLASCRLSAWRQPDAFVPVNHSVAADREQSGVLRISLAFRNGADWPQPWPQIEIRLQDVSGELIGLRRFSPKEYLNDARAPDIQPGQTVSVEIALQETSGKAADFAFEFH